MYNHLNKQRGGRDRGSNKNQNNNSDNKSNSRSDVPFPCLTNANLQRPSITHLQSRKHSVTPNMPPTSSPPLPSPFLYLVKSEPFFMHEVGDSAQMYKGSPDGHEQVLL